jgi:hypothetical protein
MTKINVCLELGTKKVFASALDWPGWSRSAQDEKQALQILQIYGQRYTLITGGAGIDFKAPIDISQLAVKERLPGSSTTDFGAPSAIPDSDNRAFELEDLEFSRAILESCWIAFDNAVQAATGKELRKGPRGGGRDLNKIIAHTLEAEQSYLQKIAWYHKITKDLSVSEQLIGIRQATLQALEQAAVAKLPEHGPRGGKLWPARYYVRRSTWHILDHAWEIEDRII